MRRNIKPGLKTLTTKLMLLPSRLRLDHHTDLLFCKPRLPHTRVRSSRTLLPPSQSQSMLKESNPDRPLSTEETVRLIWESPMVRSNGRLGLKTSTTRRIRLLSELKPDLLTDHGPCSTKHPLILLPLEERSNGSTIQDTHLAEIPNGRTTPTVSEPLTFTLLLFK